jgi:hypothetical protein
VRDSNLRGAHPTVLEDQPNSKQRVLLVTANGRPASILSGQGGQRKRSKAPFVAGASLLWGYVPSEKALWRANQLRHGAFPLAVGGLRPGSNIRESRTKQTHHLIPYYRLSIASRSFIIPF